MFEKNIQALSAKNPALAQKLMAHTVQNIDFTTTASGDYNLIYAGTPIHDLENPINEAKTVFGDDDLSEESLKVVYGLGLGYLFKRAFISSRGVIVLYEPSFDILKATLEVVDFAEELSSHRVFVFSDISEIESVFYRYSFSNVSIVQLDSYQNLFPEIFDKMYFALNRLNIEQKANVSRSFDIARSVLTNFYDLPKLPSVNVLENCFSNKAAIIVSAGPSLEKNIDLIKENRDKFLVIAIGQALKALKAAEILPDFAIAVENLPLTHQFECFSEEIDQINLVLQPSTYHELYKLPSNSTFVYYPKDDFMSKWIMRRLGYQGLEQASTVSICGFNLALLMGANPIIMTGQDLAYSEGKIYANNTIYDNRKLDINEDGSISFKITDDSLHERIYKPISGPEMTQEQAKNRFETGLSNIYKNIIQVKGQNGEMLNTSASYAGCISLYESLVKELKSKKPELSLINASEGGAYLDGFEHKQLADVVNALQLVDLTVNETVKALAESSVASQVKQEKMLQDMEKLKTIMFSIKEEAEKAEKNAQRAVKEINKFKSINKNTAKSIEKAEKSYNTLREMNKNEIVSFIYPLIQRELFSYNRERDKVTSLMNNDNILNYLKSIISFSHAMKHAQHRLEYYLPKKISV